MAAGLLLRPVGLPDKALAFTNCGYLSPADFRVLAGVDDIEDAARGVLLVVKGRAFTFEPHRGIEGGCIALNRLQREFAKVGLNQEVCVSRFEPPSALELASCRFEVEFLERRPNQQRLTVQGEDLEEHIRKAFAGQALAVGQPLALDHESHVLRLTVLSLHLPHFGGEQDEEAAPPLAVRAGILGAQTECDFQSTATGKLQVTSSRFEQRSIFRPDFNFEELGIGGLDKEFANIFRRAFAARMLPPHVVQELGIQHVRGMLLHGPPGTGKTLIARQLAKFLNAAEPKVVNGPEIFSKWIGQAEENIRKLFQDAEREYQQKGDQSQLHVIIFDEIDSICKARGSKGDSTGVHDSVVNQLLSKIDGVDAVNNVLLIGMTNRIDLIDEAMLRPGRLEVHVEISLPDEAGRADILSIHTKSMREREYLDGTVSLAALASQTKNFSGAELTGLIRSATSFALTRQVNAPGAAGPRSAKELASSIKVGSDDFERAMQEVKPAFGQHEDELRGCARQGILAYSPDFEHTQRLCESLLEQVRSSENTPLLTLLLHGIPGCGKTALAASLAQNSDYPFVRRIAAERYVGFSEQAKIAAMARVFEDAYRSPLSVIVIDDLERLIDYAPIGPRFSSPVLSALFGLLRRQPPGNDRRLLVIGTTSERGFLEEVGLARAFTASMEVPVPALPSHFRFVLERLPGFTPAVIQQLSEALAVDPQDVGIRTLMAVAEMAHQRQHPIAPATFMECLRIATGLS